MSEYHKIIAKAQEVARNMLVDMQNDLIEIDSFDVIIKASSTDDKGITTTTEYAVEVLEKADGGWIAQGLSIKQIVDDQQ